MAAQSTTLVAASSQSWSIADGSQTGLDPGSSSFSISMWVKFNTLPGTNATMFMFGKYDGSTAQKEYLGYIVHFADGSWHIFLDTSGNGSAVSTATVDGFTAPSTGVWYNWIFAYTTSTGVLNFFVNGSATGTPGTTGVTSLFNSTTSFYLGTFTDGGSSPFFDGKMDEVLFYSGVALNSTQAAALYNSPCSPSTTNLISQWKFDGNGNDSFGSNNLTNNNGATFTADVPFTCSVANTTNFFMAVAS